MSKDDNYTNVLLEDINGKFDLLLEAMGDLRSEVKQKSNQSDVDEIKSDIKVIKAAVTDQSNALADYDTRISTLEAA